MDISVLLCLINDKVAYNSSSPVFAQPKPSSSMAFFDLPIHQYHQGEPLLSTHCSTSITILF